MSIQTIRFINKKGRIYRPSLLHSKSLQRLAYTTSVGATARHRESVKLYSQCRVR